MIHLHFATALLVLLLSAAATVDFRTMRIPDPLNALIAVAGLGATWALDGSLIDSAIGMGAGYATIVAANLLYRRMRGRDGIGLGDAKLLGASGAWLGWSGLPFVLLIAAAIGLASVAALRIVGRQIDAQDAVPFGPFLCMGIAIVWTVQSYA